MIKVFTSVLETQTWGHIVRCNYKTIFPFQLSAKLKKKKMKGQLKHVNLTRHTATSLDCRPS